MKHAVLHRLKRLTDQSWKIREQASGLRMALDRMLSERLRQGFVSIFTNRSA